MDFKGKMKFSLSISLLIFIIMFCCQTTVYCHIINLKLPDRVLIHQDRIILGELALIEGIRGKELKDLENIELGKAPLPGYKRELSRELIELTLQAEGYLLSDFELDMNRSIIVETAIREINREELIAYAKKYIRSQYSVSGGEIMIEAGFFPPSLKIPDTEYILKIQDNVVNKLLGNITLPIEVIINDKVWTRVYPGMEIKIIKDVFVAERNINRGEKLRREDFYLERMELSNINGELINKWDNPLLIDGVVTIPIAKGDLLTTYYLQRPVLISWGDEVQAEVVVGNVRIKTSVKAYQSGKKGDFITVENTISGYRFKAMVVNSNLVRVLRD